MIADALEAHAVTLRQLTAGLLQQREAILQLEARITQLEPLDRGRQGASPDLPPREADQA